MKYTNIYVPIFSLYSYKITYKKPVIICRKLQNIHTFLLYRIKKKLFILYFQPLIDLEIAHLTTVGCKNIRALEIIRVKKLIFNAVLLDKSLSNHDLLAFYSIKNWL